MKKLILSVVAAVALATPALAADLRVKAPPPPAPPPSPWDVAFGAGCKATTSSAASRSPTTSRRLTPTSSRATTSRRSCSSTPEPRARASRSRTAPRPRLTASPVSGRPSVHSPSISAASTTGIPAGAASMAPPFPRLRHRLPRERLPAGQRQRHQEGPDLLGSVRKGHLHGQRSGRVRRRGLLLAVGAQLRRQGHLHGRQREVHRSERGHAGRLGTVPVRRSRPLVPRHQRRLLRRRRVSRTAFPTRATPPGTSASASPRACSRSTSATTIPT